MTATVLPFPPARRRAYVRKQAGFMLGLSAESAERHLRRQVALQRQTLTTKGVAPDTVDAACVALEGTIRAEVWRLMFAEGGAA
jgi:hypothetical protein